MPQYLSLSKFSPNIISFFFSVAQEEKAFFRLENAPKIKDLYNGFKKALETVFS